ncbi:MAG: hypothetical protein ACJ74O_07955 [Frankiaceae bacterium]
MTDHPPRRTTVAHPLTVQARQRTGAAPATPVTADRLREIDEQSALGILLIRSLVRAQLSLALRLVAVLGCVLGGLPLLLAVLPDLRAARVAGIELPWLLLGVLVYPLFLAGSALYVRLAERNERDFVEVVRDG